MTGTRYTHLREYQKERSRNRFLEAEIRIPVGGPTAIGDDETGQVYGDWVRDIRTYCPSKWFVLTRGGLWVQLKPPDGRVPRIKAAWERYE